MCHLYARATHDTQMALQFWPSCGVCHGPMPETFYSMARAPAHLQLVVPVTSGKSSRAYCRYTPIWSSENPRDLMCAAYLHTRQLASCFRTPLSHMSIWQPPAGVSECLTSRWVFKVARVRRRRFRGKDFFFGFKYQGKLISSCINITRLVLCIMHRSQLVSVQNGLPSHYLIILRQSLSCIPQ